MRLVLVGGVPGAGKSTYAATLAKEQGMVWVENDHWRERRGTFVYIREEAHAAKAWCHCAAWAALQQGKDVVVSNTFTTKEEIKPYQEIAKELGAAFELILLDTDRGSVHDVPKHFMQMYREQLEKLRKEVI